MSFNIGDKVWTTSHTEESKAYGMCDARHPWEGVVTKVFPDGMLSYRICSVSTLFPEGYDDDSNASAHVYAQSVFATREEAMRQHLVELRKDLEAAEWKVTLLQKLMVEVGHEVIDYPTTEEPIKNYIRYEIRTLEGTLKEKEIGGR